MMFLLSVGGGRPTLGAASLPVEADSLEGAASGDLEKAPKTEEQAPPPYKPDPKGPCPGGCPERAA